MIFYGMQIINLTIKGCSFVGNGANYNDGIKIDSTASFGVKGNVSIINNHFENYSQYTIWVRSYSEGTYEIKIILSKIVVKQQEVMLQQLL